MVVVPGQRAAVDRVGARVVDGEARAVHQDLAVAASPVGLQLDAQPAVGRRPQASAGAGEQRIGALAQARLVDEVVGEVDARRHALRGRRGQRVADGLGQRLGRRREAAAGRGEGDRGAGGREDDDPGAEGQQAAGGDAAQEPHRGLRGRPLQRTPAS